jgi:hypothetical protein
MPAKQKIHPSTVSALTALSSALTAIGPNNPITRGRRKLTGPEIQVQKWVRGNRGVLTRLAKEFDLSVTFIQQVTYLRCKSLNGRVEARLAVLGCPGHRK